LAHQLDTRRPLTRRFGALASNTGRPAPCRSSARSSHELADSARSGAGRRIHRQNGAWKPASWGELDACRTAAPLPPFRAVRSLSDPDLPWPSRHNPSPVPSVLRPPPPTRVPEAPCRLDSLVDALAGVVAWNQDEVTPGSFLHPVPQRSSSGRSGGWRQGVRRRHPCPFAAELGCEIGFQSAIVSLRCPWA